MYLKAGTITKTIGLKGEVKIYSTSSFGERRFKKDHKVFLKEENGYKEFTVKKYRKIDNSFFALTFDEINSIKETEKIIHNDIFVLKNDDILKSNEFYYVDLIGCKIINQNNAGLGEVILIEEFPAQITLKCLSKQNKEFYVPFIEQFILKIDIENKIIQVNEIEGML